MDINCMVFLIYTISQISQHHLNLDPPWNVGNFPVSCKNELIHAKL